MTDQEEQSLTETSGKEKRIDEGTEPHHPWPEVAHVEIDKAEWSEDLEPTMPLYKTI